VPPAPPDAEPDAGLAVLLDIPPRLQWANGNGYCGETSIQSIGLFYGAWISQSVAREVAGGEVLLGVNAEQALPELRFRIEVWDPGQATPQFERYMLWLEGHILAGHPCLIAAFLADSGDPDYDHIMPATGIERSGPSGGLDPQDVLVFNNLFDPLPMNREFSGLGATREQCDVDLDRGGCIPRQVAYGIAVTGIVDPAGATRPVHLAVEAWDEPNVSLGAPPSQMTGRVTVAALTPGESYALLRYDDYAQVPTAGDAAQYLTSSYTSRVDFTATSPTWSREDPAPFPSNGTTYFRCVPLP
jgi:hypothetical protein